MLPRCDSNAPLRVMGIDPGTDTLGVSVLDVCLATNRVSIIDAKTYSGSALSKDLFPHLRTIHGDKYGRLKAHELNLYWIIEGYGPHEVISESPYMGSFASTYGALLQCLMCINNALMAYDWRMPLLLVDPASVKKNIGVNGKSGDKSLMTKAVLSLIQTGALHNPNNIDIEALDEHSIDSIAVAYVRTRYVVENNVYTWAINAGGRTSTFGRL